MVKRFVIYLYFWQCKIYRNIAILLNLINFHIIYTNTHFWMLLEQPKDMRRCHCNFHLGLRICHIDCHLYCPMLLVLDIWVCTKCCYNWNHLDNTPNCYQGNHNLMIDHICNYNEKKILFLIIYTYF